MLIIKLVLGKSATGQILNGNSTVYFSDYLTKLKGGWNPVCVQNYVRIEYSFNNFF